MQTTMTTDYAEAAFGTVPPDLSLVARSRGTHWVYNYLMVASTRSSSVSNRSPRAA